MCALCFRTTIIHCNFQLNLFLNLNHISKPFFLSKPNSLYSLSVVYVKKCFSFLLIFFATHFNLLIFKSLTYYLFSQQIFYVLILIHIHTSHPMRCDRCVLCWYRARRLLQIHFDVSLTNERFIPILFYFKLRCCLIIYILRMHLFYFVGK